MESPSPLAFGAQLRQYRLAADLSQEDLAARSGLSVRSISNMERGVPHRPRRDTVRQLGDALGLATTDRTHFETAARGWRLQPEIGHRLPVPPSGLVGRRTELATARRVLSSTDVALLTLVGPAGVGKTRLALEVAVELSATSPDGTWFVDLAPVADSALVGSAIAGSLGVRPVGKRGLADALQAHLRSRSCLLVLDNFEHVLEAAPAVEALIAVCPGLKILVTSREPLHLRREHLLPVHPLPLPSRDRQNELPDLAGIDSVALFLRRARAVQPGFDLTTENAPAVAELCIRLDGLPLAIELAAARVALLPPQAMLARLHHRLPLLAWDARDLPERHRTLEAAIDWSYALLAPADQSLFRRLGTFVGGWTLEAAEAVADPQGLGLPALAALASLVDKSLVVAAGTPHDLRFGMLETIREHARERLAASGEMERVRDRHAAHYLALAERAEPELTGAEQVVWLDRLEREHDNLRAALRWALEEAESETACRLGGALWRFWMIRGHLSEGRRWLDAALTPRGEVPDAVRAQAFIGAGRLARQQGVLAPAEARFEDALRLLRRLGDQSGVAVALGQLGVLAYDRGDFDGAARLHGESLALRRQQGDLWGTAGTLTNLGEVARHQGRYRQATVLHEESLSLFRRVGDPWGVSLALTNLGVALHHLGDNERAAAMLEESLVVGRRLGDKAGMAESIEGLGRVAAARGAVAGAVRLFGAATAVRDTLGAPLPPSDRVVHDRVVATARATLGDDAFWVAWETGRAWPLEQTIAELHLPRMDQESDPDRSSAA